MKFMFDLFHPRLFTKESFMVMYIQKLNYHILEAKKNVPNRHVDKEMWELARLNIQEAKFYKNKIRELEKLDEISDKD